MHDASVPVYGKMGLLLAKNVQLHPRRVGCSRLFEALHSSVSAQSSCARRRVRTCICRCCRMAYLLSVKDLTALADSNEPIIVAPTSFLSFDIEIHTAS